ncbi:circadian-associated transcriptional repressor [Oryzias melastigma]|uniref:Circadian associated repressor of transcription n=1 Tax=Oryzias melastigma TaxID=30732 RepID=A0A3B3DA56_ORYME|nr:circadian-associated transcriptional repressor [Oryzias melastigma]
MQSQRSTSTQPSFDSIGSSDSLLFSDSEQAEDDTDVFLTDSSSSVIICGTSGATTKRDNESESSRSQWTCDSFMDKEEEEESCKSESVGKASHAGKTDTMGQAPKSRGDLLFAQKCAELQGFVRPLLELLNGLKKGRFDYGLNSFQQSVAMDRIQRIVGVLQRPDSGEKYLNTLLQVEMMLKLWFPQISTQPVCAASTISISPTHSLQETSGSTPPHKHKDQLHIPVKKRRLSWTDTESPTPSPILSKSPRASAEERGVKHNQDIGDLPISSTLLVSNTNQRLAHLGNDNQIKSKFNERREPGKILNYKAGHSSEPSLTWVHVTPILSPRKACFSHNDTANASSNERILTSKISSPAMQDSFISSTTPSNHTNNQKKSVLCQGQSVADKQSDRETTQSHPGQSQSPLVMLKPLPEVCPAILET